MTVEQGLIAAIVLGAIVMFAWGRWRHDMVALAALLLSVAAGLVPGEEAFAGFGHPAVITVACVLVLSRGLQTSGAIDVLAARLIPAEAGPMLSIGLLSAIAAVLSAFMNNVGALALLMPLALQRARKLELAPGQVLMPLAFASILGGMTTLIGTPPNLVVSAFRAQARAQDGGGGFAMFDFAPVGLAVATAGVVFIVAFARLLVPARNAASLESFDTAAYLTEAKAPENAKAVGMSLAEVEAALEAADVQVLGLLRNEVRLRAPGPEMTVRAGDILQLEADPEALTSALAKLGLVLEEADQPERKAETKPEKDEEREKPDAAQASTDASAPVLQEMVVMPGARIAGRSATDIALRTRYSVNLLAISRQGRRSMARLRATHLMPGDVLLMQGREEAIATFAADLGCIPLAPRALNLPDRRRIILSVGLMLGAVGLAASGIVPASVAFAAGMLGAMITNVVPPRTVYGAIDWPVIVLLGALIPVADAVAGTGLADLLARTLVQGVAGGDAVIALALILVVTMTLSDVVNNTATAAVMCPIALGTAASLGVSADAFLMAVAVGASCAFLTPIGHQNNTLILGPGGFKFRDYWRLGLPLEIIVVAVGISMLLVAWPLT